MHTQIAVGTEVAERADSQRALRAARVILATLFGPPNTRAFAVRYWDGSAELPVSRQQPEFTVIIRRPGALRRMFFPPSELALGEAYLRDDFDVEGDMEAAVRTAMSLVSRVSPARLLALVPKFRSLPTDDLADPALDEGSERSVVGRLHSRERDAAAIGYHYDVGNDFYQLWLDPRMVYSCAYFPTGNEDLATAQEAKLDLICRKLRLKAGERVLDIGCGWGGFIQFAAERYGVDATGITLSREQAELARDRIAAAGLADRCRVLLCDYRDFKPAERFDKVVSIGMFEHVGESQLPVYFRRAFELVRPGGLFLNHGIARSAPELGAEKIHWLVRPFWRPNAFIHRYVFPDGALLTASSALQFGEQAGFEIRDVENLREHYTLTLRHWVRRLETRREEAIRLVGETKYRIWRLYMAASADSFRAGRNGLIQALFSRPTASGVCELPRTRADIYETATSTQSSAAA